MITPAMKALLNAIGSKEAPRGYNQIYTPAEKIVGFPKLTKMTLAEIRSLQGRMLKGGSASTAVGRYQFLRKTLDATRKAMGVPLTAVWTPDLQDRMAVHLMENRGLNQYLAGKMTRETFANSLAKEWASLPVVTRIKGQKRMVNPGESFYAGDGLNAALHDPAHILKLVDALKSPVERLPVSGVAKTPPAHEASPGAPNAPEEAISEPVNEAPITPSSGEALIRALQTELQTKRYYDGAIDGKPWGLESLTGDAIVLLQTRNNLAVERFAIEMRDVLAAKPYIVAAREDATVKTLVEKGEPRATFWSRVKKAAYGVLGYFGITEGGSALDQAEQGIGLWSRIKGLFEPFAGASEFVATYWPWFAAGGAAVLIGFAIKQQRHAVEDYKVAKSS